LAACAQIRRWVYDHGQDCRKTKGMAHGCYGQVERRDQESLLACWGIDRE
ncbi:lysozyme, partial [Salmonella enterica subsp. enterica]|nr:lysozyme [Salmonella enterica subsp. enterica]EJI1767446.1 lysozyme [Salmonella enterica]